MRKTAVFLALVLLLVLGATPALANGVPELPHAFYGSVTVNGAPASNGTQVSATVNIGEIISTQNPVTTVGGNYGIGSPYLLVQGYDIPDGATITFHVTNQYDTATGGTKTFVAGGGPTRHDLSVTIPTPPTVTTSAATAIGTTTATLNGSLTNRGSASSVQVSFQWGLTTAYGNETAPQTMTSTGSFSAPLSGLSSSTTYHFGAKAVGEGTGYGVDMTFTTGTPAPGGGGGGPGDTTPPTISDILASAITKTSADIAWETNEKSDSQVEYWSSPGEFSPLDTERVIYHLVHLTDLTPGTTYHYKTMSKDAAGNLAVSDEHSFTTLGLPATFTISNLSVSPTEVDIGEKVTISAVVANTGDAKGTYEVTLKINGVIAETKKVDVDAGASKTVTFTVVRDVAGTYSVEVDGLKGSFTVKEKAAPPPPPPPPPGGPPVKAPISWPVVGGIIGGVVIIGLLIFFLVRRRAA